MSTKNSGLSIVGLKLTDCVRCFVYYISIYSAVSFTHPIAGEETEA